MTSYELLKPVHVGCVALSISFFAVRGYWALRGSSLLQAPVVRILPHVIDTVLLASAIGLVAVTGQYPFVADWLTVKVFALIVYILLGTLAIRRARSRPVQLASYLAALATALFMVSVAYARHPLGLFYLLRP